MRTSRRWIASVIVSWLCVVAVAQENSADKKDTIDEETFGSERARDTARAFPSRGARTDLSILPRTPEETVKSFRLLEGLEAEVVLHEPEVRQPVFLNFDERGRMWVVQFIQYPYPAGIKIVDFDDQFHAVYDRVPPPPPYHDRGKDRITIHADEDGDGIFETHKVFLDGLNMATSVAHGRGGVWVLQPPYLLFYPDADRDDVPDGDPRVHLAGFGLEDTHSAANSLRFGPDGWLYGGQGSGSSATIRRPGIDDGPGLYFKGQAVWRYHPERRVFELYSEGGGNTFGVEIDAAGHVFSGLNGAGARGYHFVQGGYYQKSWGEHGYLTNPNAFGFFGAMKHDGKVPRFSHTFVIYEDGALGPRFEGRLVSAVPLRNEIVLSDRSPDRSTFQTRDVAKVIKSDDRWFRPVDIKVGPDGALYVADWYDTRLTHMDPRDSWDRERGRIYRIRRANAPATPPFDLAMKSSVELVGLLQDARKWYRRQALRLLADRKDRSVVPLLLRHLRSSEQRHVVNSLWALNLVGGLTLDVARELISHSDADVRRFTLRLLGDRPRELDTEFTRALVALARTESDPRVRSQFAASARRFDADTSLRVTFALLGRGDDADDPHIPLLLWWALEKHVESQRDRVVAAFRKETLWKSPVVRNHILARLSRRYAQSPTPDNQRALAALLRQAPDGPTKDRLVDGVREAFRGRGARGLAESLIAALDEASADSQLDATRVELRLRSGDRGALVPAIALITTEHDTGDTPEAMEARRMRVRLIETVSELGLQEVSPVLLELVGRSTDEAVRSACLAALGRLDAPDLPRGIFATWSRLGGRLRHQALGVLVSRRAWARSLIHAVGASGSISKSEIPDDIVNRLRLFGDDDMTALVVRTFGREKRATSKEKTARIAELAAIIRSGPAGDPAAGRVHFQKLCGTCHKLFAEGGRVGPDLTVQERSNLDNMLLQTVDPSAGIREGYTQFVVVTTGGRTLTGVIVKREGDRLELLDPTGRIIVLRTEQIVAETAQSTSLMPEGLLDGLDKKSIRDFFAYFMSSPAGASGDAKVP